MRTLYAAVAVVALLGTTAHAIKCKPSCSLGSDGKVHCTVTCNG